MTTPDKRSAPQLLPNITLEDAGEHVTRSRRFWPRAVAILISACLLSLAAWLWFRDAESAPEMTTAVEASLVTAEVIATDLELTDTLDGELGRVEGDPIIAHVNGTLTATVAEGAEVNQGSVLYRVDNRPVVLLLGVLPTWRSLSDQSDDGPDILQLEQALVALGYDPDSTVTIDEAFSSRTEEMVERWQEDVGTEVDGIVDLGEVVFLSDPVRISEQLLAVGGSVRDGDAVLATSSSVILVTTSLPTQNQGDLTEGQAVTVVLPGDVAVSASVVRVGSTAVVGADGQATFEVSVALDDEDSASGLDQVPVEIEYVSSSVEGVMAVPVTALLALAEGGYAVELVEEAGSTRLVAVEPGFFTDELVEVTSPDLQIGDRVVVP